LRKEGDQRGKRVEHPEISPKERSPCPVVAGKGFFQKGGKDKTDFDQKKKPPPKERGSAANIGSYSRQSR